MDDRFTTPQNSSQTITSQPNGIGNWKPENSIRNLDVQAPAFDLIEISNNTLKIITSFTTSLVYTIPSAVDLSNQEAFVFNMQPFPNSFKIFMILEDDDGKVLIFNTNNTYPAFTQMVEIKLSDFKPFTDPVNLNAIERVTIDFRRNDTNFSLIITQFFTISKSNLINSCGY